MKLVTRLWTFGALVPALGCAAAFLLAGEIFRQSMKESQDEALLAQATTEAISLFDAPDAAVHLHMEISPLLEQVRPFAPVASVYGPDGALLLVFPKDAEVPPKVAPSPRIEEPVLLTDEARNARELLVTLHHPKEQRPYTLRLESSYGGIDATMRRFHLAAALLTGAFSLCLGVFQAIGARSVAIRIAGLARHVAAVARGDLERLPPDDRAGDEISDLRDGVAHATLELKGNRDARERFIADAAHELRTPLAAMRTSLDLALRRQRSPEELREALTETRDEVDRLTALSSRLLDLAAMRSAPLALETVDLRELAASSHAAYEALAQARGIRLVLEGGSVPAKGDPATLRQAIDNVLHNAIKLTRTGGTIRTKMEVSGHRAAIVVEDEGPGIAAADREAVFEPFHRVILQVKGTGLGLPLVREIASRHGGSARFEEPPSGRGARFVFSLPLLG
ncbi:sensor histidine kinase [Vulgatibacter incomptus]|uniref:histidine kinase n=1 Tax=Vulgatibacter incomptus TaxID=1391653 RepID=A0A0K1PG27_9BACT|nr:ATP-binding protein [Vulgatibacter incomptus]AKU92488.1 Sensory histidine kinase QseC [Vulgatibacter incomptus]